MNSSNLGISSACFYPEDTLRSIKRCTSLGFHTVEIFMNTFDELKEPYIRNIADHCRETGTVISSIHPFTSSYEYMLFFSEYKGRAASSADFYKCYFNAAAYLGAKYVIFHGDASKTDFCGMERYCEAIRLLNEVAADFGVSVIQENVSTARSGKPQFIRELREAYGGGLKFAFDIKQAARAGYSPEEMMDAMGGDIVHVHINDWSETDCRLPLAGKLDIKAILDRLNRIGYNGKYIIEVYRRNFKEDSEISDSARGLLAL